MEVATYLVVLALMCAVLSFPVLAGIVSLVHRLIRGRFLDLLTVRAGIAFGVYLLLWIFVLFAVASGVAITH